MLNLRPEEQPRWRVGWKLFYRVVDAENYKLDEPVYAKARQPIEFFYLDRWHVVGARPEPSRIAI